VSVSAKDMERIPLWSVGVPLFGALLLAAKYGHLISAQSTVFMVLIVAGLGSAIFAAVHHADVLAVKVGDPFGSVLLALAITVMEVAVILSVMAAGASGAETVARDTVFAAVMIVLNGIVGICLVIGGLKHHEQGFRTDGAAAILSVIATIAVISLVLPNFTLAEPGPVYAPAQLLFVGVASFVLYGVFLFVQTSRHRDYFLDGLHGEEGGPLPGARMTLVSAVLLGLSLVVVILLAKALTPAVEREVAEAGLPVSFVGVVIAAIILLPEGVAALRAAYRNRLQMSLNAALGSALASIGLTIPMVAVASLVLGQTLVLGLNAEGMTLLILTLFISSLTLATGRTTIMQGAIHLVIFGVFLTLSAVP
jgi:Ca2+:H+ antiporter